MNQICCLQGWPKLCWHSVIKYYCFEMKTRVKTRYRAHLSLCLMKHHAMKMYRKLKAELQTLLNSPTNMKWTVTITFQPFDTLGNRVHYTHGLRLWWAPRLVNIQKQNEKCLILLEIKPHHSVHGLVAIPTDRAMTAIANKRLHSMENTEYFT